MGPANDKINYLAAALKAAKEDKVRLLREVERKRKAAGDATVAFYATVAKSTHYDQENPLPSPVYHATSPPPSPQSPPLPRQAGPLAGDASDDDTVPDSQPDSPVIGAQRPLRDTRPMLLWGSDNK